MMKPDFLIMSRKALRQYVLEHRDNLEAFQVYVDRSEAEAHWIELPPVQTAAELEQFPQFMDKIRAIK
ncbi:MAG: hypothetical protein ACFCU8_05030 [Thermosynechococcaceae cyanobacterium]